MTQETFFVAIKFGQRQEVWETTLNPNLATLKKMATQFFGDKRWRFDADDAGFQTHLDDDHEIELAIKSGILKRPRMTVIARHESNPEWDDPRPWHLRGPFSG